MPQVPEVPRSFLPYLPMSLSLFNPAVARWFEPDDRRADPRAGVAGRAIRERRDTLIAAPTGSGKTLAAFLTALDDLVREGSTAPLPDEVRVVYVSPLKALSADIHKNLAEPRRGIRRAGARRLGVEAPRSRQPCAPATRRRPSARRCCARRRTSW